MPSFDIVRKHKPEPSFRVESVVGKFDLQTTEIEERFSGDIDTDFDWSVGLIVGASGTGKTTIAKQLFPKAYMPKLKFGKSAIIEDMPKGCSMDQITRMFNSVGFSSPPSWLKPHGVLSNGEKMRAELARLLLEDKQLVVFDEFTSVVDRNVAKVGSFAVQKAVRKVPEKQFIAVTCHYDVEDWLLPDWVFNTDTMTFKKKSPEKGPSSTSKSTKSGQKKKRPIGDCFLSTTI